MKTLINPQHLWKYREFDRSLTPAPSCFGIVQYTVEQIADYLKSNPIEPVTLVIIDHQCALLVDGNHRLKASLINGTNMIPLEVIDLTKTQAEQEFTPHVLQRFVNC